jgi:hypothetical protein
MNRISFSMSRFTNKSKRTVLGGSLYLFSRGRHSANLHISSKMKVKHSHNTLMEAQRGRGGIAPTHSRPRH